MSEHVLFLTGKLAAPSLERVLSEITELPFTWQIEQLGVSVAALLTADMVERRLENLHGAHRVIFPGKCRGDFSSLEEKFGVPFIRGPEEIKDLPGFFGSEGVPRDLTQSDVLLFAEVCDAPYMTVAGIVEQARRYRRDGADVIDIGFVPDVPFGHLEDSIAALHEDGFVVSIDSLQPDDLLRGARAGADYMLSLTAETLWIADEVDATPVLLGSPPADLDSLLATVDRFAATGRPYFADPIIEPIHYGFTTSIARYLRLRQLRPDCPIMMGVGNLTELTHADTAGINALLLGIMSELDIRAMLTTEVSPHCRRAVKEADLARRIMHAARADNVPPRHIDEGLLALHERKPFAHTAAELRELAAAVRDRNYRIYASEEGVHVFNKDRFLSAVDPYDFFPELDVDDDAAHAFYLGLELARAQIAWQLGKRYQQDQELLWGCATDVALEDMSRYSDVRSTLEARRRR
ncbi:MAG: dihydropteroate synthase [Gammaproteobacteria bacterium]|nr:dihydropteroate synthase [Gammaproteobacteria bacterium]